MIDKYGIEPVRKAVKDLYMILSLFLETKGYLPEQKNDNFGPESAVERDVLDVVYNYIELGSSRLRHEDNRYYYTETTPKDFISIENFWKAIVAHDLF